MTAPSGLYIHWPYCLRKCPYCDFPSRTGRIPPDFGQALLREWSQRASELPSPLASVYIGGGTPSLMPPALIGALLDAVAQWHNLSDVEITLEANPASATRAWLGDVRRLGVNRLSLGVQSFSDDVLHFLGRLHSAAESHEAIQAARAAGFTNLSLDLILATRPATRRQLSADLEAALRYAPEHLSAYLLSLEERTPFGRRARRGEALTLPDEAAADQYLFASQRLAEAGFRHYEISNFARPGYESRHNSLYWSGAAYLGLGPGAHSFSPEVGCGVRRANLPDPSAYQAALAGGEDAPHVLDILDSESRRLDVLLTALRRDSGLGEHEYALRAQRPWDELPSALLETWVSCGWAEWRVRADGERAFRFTPSGWLLSDALLADLAAEL